MLNRFFVTGAALLLLSGIAVTSVARPTDDPMSGTWKLNLAKSKYDPGPAPKSVTVVIKIENGTETYKSEGVDASGKATLGSFTAKLDGTDSPLTGIAYADTVSLKRIAPNHVVARLKKDGKMTMTVDVVVATDGMSRKLIYSGKNEQGKEVHDVLVFDKEIIADTRPDR
jgi:hypothetical protein